MSKFNIDNDAIRQLAELLDDTNLTEIEVAAGDNRIRVARQGTMVAAAPAAPVAAAPAPVAAAAAAPSDAASHPGAVKSPMVGVVYFAPEPGAAPFISVGSTVAEGQTLMLIEAMKTFNPIRAPKSGKVTQILATDGHPVEYDEPLIIIE
ncbi:MULTISPECIES: acetyl-CoA carboxylase biotin carboxyl carrier protein [Thalassospira]|jgi:acetyl-CoA carboxylase biotin carboxyl carrier protein|uniref:Biotin carboxyl carrier protein of acetyl-CoA carboxylase n=1 Tax=Thalassospira povalilytica TaxID=732237 RepID=A0A8I1SJU5_9PROT|nr:MULTISPECIES: acetyl-CoA carboxylase biotin carboxyl carrier protein [Thalassospira]MEE3044007.1 acetyl-CoA carboxylase biotin carboxyl carrier protein [Pseudomonadota bacterium]RCK23655.1 acetyl-CoA carboxylase [Thalassospira profundimaris]MAL39264.1 acetyl-CoA carboxylase, biotin carboxyl carrier protein [Thalassospira sp.]MBN8198772.1 acetyl-CoA carboxylase biotin carboxyl carrier protein [Thalassospira povalilytica]MBO6773293.1 acetyl-CoA carboxylase biotin carboxyl carrier protein [Tha|tara:strand:+ start:530 stop:979 length:450 start_codon:yes stop_codon:yes gene_type:complete|eukprot:NODE_277_length_2152_cov_1.483457_g271_i0.p4 GENE.NODE_277_length_2152_cov_1.483457_g271_i0~~NODE_277_length_2152_cov_1.483457_g271_i0.p4  ORF type:complete len:150 (-),score=39.58 NODE_277_length_2152_cov_1.483457_g271_i0:266-715(-)